MKNLFRAKTAINLVVLNIATILLMILNSMYPEFLLLNSFLLPIPFAIIYALYDKRIVSVSFIIDIILTMLTTENIILTTLTGFVVLILAIIIGRSIRRKTGIGIALSEIFSATVALSVISVSIYIIFIEKTSLYEIFKLIRDFIDEYLKSMASAEELSGIVISTEDILVNIPIMFIIYYMINSILNYFITLKITAALNKDKISLKPFSQYYLSNILGAVLIIAYCLGAIVDRFGFAIGNYISNSIYFILTTLLSVNGLAFLYNFLINKFKYNRTISIIILIGSFFILPDVFVLIGFTEMILDYRKLDPHRIFRRK